MNDFDNDKLVGDMIIATPSQYTLNKLSSFNWIELWYFSPDTCHEAAQQAFSTSDNIYSLAKANDTLGLWSISSAKASKNVVQDKDLNW